MINYEKSFFIYIRKYEKGEEYMEVRLSADEICKILQISKSALNKFKDCQERQRKKGVILTKYKEGGRCSYTIEYENIRADVFSEEEDKMLPLLYDNVISAPNYEYMAFIGIGASPNMAFSGTYKDFLKYLNVRVDKENIEDIKFALESLKRKNMIRYYPDEENEEWFLAGISWRVNEAYGIRLDTVRDIIYIQKKYNKRQWTDLMKIYTDIIYQSEIAEGMPRTSRAISIDTGLKQTTLSQKIKVLQSEGRILSKVINVNHGDEVWECQGKDITRSEFNDKNDERKHVGPASFSIDN